MLSRLALASLRSLHGGTAGSSVSPLLKNVDVVRVWPEPPAVLLGSLVPLSVVSLPPGSARLRRHVEVALGNSFLVMIVGACVILIFSGCTRGSEKARRSVNAVLYSIGLSTDPYGHSRPHGFGVVTGIGASTRDKVEIRERGLGGFGGAEWLDAGLILVPRPAPPLRRPLLFRYDGRLERRGSAPIPGGAGYAWSPRVGLFAYEPAIPCSRQQRSLYECYRASGKLFVVSENGSDQREVLAGHLMGWTADGRIGFFRSYQRAIPRAFDLDSGKSGPILPGWKVELPIWSPDGRFVAAVARSGVVIARADGRIVQTIPSRLVISMIAWSPVGRRLAFTTSGFPNPHQLFVVDRPSARRRLLFVAGSWHFDWITWSPDGTRILLDDENRGRWLLFRTDRSGKRRTLPRLGGRPLWCCPVNSFSANGTVRNS